MKRILTATATAAVVVAGLVGAGPAAAATSHGPYATKADCVHWAGVYEFHGSIVTVGCNKHANGKWYFTTR